MLPPAGRCSPASSTSIDGPAGIGFPGEGGGDPCSCASSSSIEGPGGGACGIGCGGGGPLLGGGGAICCCGGGGGASCTSPLLMGCGERGIGIPAPGAGGGCAPGRSHHGSS